MGAKRAVNLSLDSDLVDRADAAGLDLSSIVEAKLREVVGEAETVAWEDENRAATASFNRYIEAHGTVGESERRYG